MNQYVYHLTYRSNSKIKNCYECSFCYDMLYCVAKSDDDEKVIRAEEYGKPDRCPLKFVGEEAKK